MKRGGFLQRHTALKSRVAIQRISKNPLAQTKKRIQALLREICLLRDKQCVLRFARCGRVVGDEGVVWQADHLISRANSATYGDSRLVVLVCRDCHAWKSLGSNLRKGQYDDLVKRILPKERVALWGIAEASAHRPFKADWVLVEMSLIQELKVLKDTQGLS